MFCDFETTTHGKWILAGEHTVLRQGGALVFPIIEKKLTLTYRADQLGLSANYEGEQGPDAHLLFWSVLEQGLNLLNQSINTINGHFILSSNIPVGVGMGASAALCVAMTRWFAAQKCLPTTEIFTFAKELENLFHGQSSGLDIAGVSANTGVYFKEGHYSSFQQAWQPHWLLSSCGQIGITSHCIKQVQKLWESNPDEAATVDAIMEKSVQQARYALTHNEPDSQAQLVQAMSNAAECFYRWNLVSENLQKHMEDLKKAGALAVKPTGSGGGGYVVSLWEAPPPQLLPEQIKI